VIQIDSMLADRNKWFDASGERAQEILSTRIRLARNLRGVRFVGRARNEELAHVLETVRSALSSVPPFGEDGVTAIGELSILDRHVLLERHLLSHDLTSEIVHRGLAVAPDESLSVMVNEEDHLRIQSLASGLQLQEAWGAANRLDEELAKNLPLAFDENLGYLTACPTNVGTGLRASVLVHLPSLVLTQRIKKVLSGVTQVGLAVRGFHGEGTEVLGNFFQISNQVTLGISEEGTLGKLEGVVTQVLEMEKKAREALLRDARRQVEDKIGRALGTLKYSCLLSSQECMGLLSALRFGVTIGLPNLPDLGTLNEILIYCQPAHMQRLAKREMSSTERNAHRADWIQGRLRVRDGLRSRQRRRRREET
jgi:protein arginine kinase